MPHLSFLHRSLPAFEFFSLYECHCQPRCFLTWTPSLTNRGSLLPGKTYSYLCLGLFFFYKTFDCPLCSIIFSGCLLVTDSNFYFNLCVIVPLRYVYIHNATSKMDGRRMLKVFKCSHDGEEVNRRERSGILVKSTKENKGVTERLNKKKEREFKVKGG